MNDLPSDGFTAHAPLRRAENGDAVDDGQTKREIDIRKESWLIRGLLVGVIAAGAGGFIVGKQFIDRQAGAEAVAAYDKALQAIERGEQDIEDKIMGKRALLTADEKEVVLVAIEATLRHHEPTIGRSKVLQEKAKDLAFKIRESRRILAAGRR